VRTSPLLLLVGCFLVPQLMAGPPTAVPRLAGVVCLPERKVEILEVKPTGSGRAGQLILNEGQREGEVEVIQIESEKGIVKFPAGGTDFVENFHFENRTHQSGGTGSRIMLDRADMDPVLKLHSEFKDLNLLRSARLPTVVLGVNVSPTNKLQAALVLEQALAGKGITTIQDGEKFLIVVLESEAATVRPRSAEIKSAAATGDQMEFFPPGAINFTSGSLNQVAQIYAAIVDCKLESYPRSTLPDAAVKFQNQTPLSMEECLYALETLFGWQGLKAVPGNGNLAKIILDRTPP